MKKRTTQNKDKPPSLCERVSVFCDIGSALKSPCCTILESISDGVFTIDLDKRITSFNRAAETITGFRSGEAIGQYCFDVFRASICEKKCAMDKTLLANGRNGSACLKRLGKLHPFNPEKIDFLHRVLRIAEKHVFLSFNILKRALVSEVDMRALLSVFLPDVDIEDTIIPYAASTVDLVAGAEVILKQGPLIPAVMASCAVPGFLPPLAHDGMVLVDGAVLYPVPVEAARAAGADHRGGRGSVSL